MSASQLKSQSSRELNMDAKDPVNIPLTRIGWCSTAFDGILLGSVTAGQSGTPFLYVRSLELTGAICKDLHNHHEATLLWP